VNTGVAKAALLCCVGILGACRPLRAQTYTRRSELPPVHLNYNDLAAIVGRAEQLISTANKPFSPEFERPSESLDLQDDQTKVEFTQDITTSALESAPPISNEIYFTYSFNGAPISNVTMYLYDYRRELSISGQSKTDVDALSQLMSSDLARHTTILGGFGFRTVGFLLLTILYSTLFALGFAPNLSKMNRIITFSIAAILVISVWAAPWQNWFPGTAVYSGDVSWFVRNQAIVSFMGMCATVVFGFIAVLAPFFRQRPIASPATESTAASPSQRPETPPALERQGPVDDPSNTPRQ
jgi:hypothetical protein